MTRAQDVLSPRFLAWLRAQPRRPRSWGSVVVKVDARGRVTFKPKATVDGLTRWGRGVSVKAIPGLSRETCERRAYAQAEQHRRELLRALERNPHAAPADARVSTLCVLADWFRAVEGSDRSPGTVARYAQIKAVLEAEVGRSLPGRIAAIGPQDVRALHASLRSRGRASSTVRYAHDRLLQVLRWANRQRISVDEAVLAGAVEPPGHTRKEKRSVSVAEAQRLLAEMADEQPFGPLVAVMYYQGLRDSEASALCWGDIGPTGIDVKRKRDAHSRKVGAPKADSAGWLPLLPQTKVWLERRRVWCVENGWPSGAGDWVFGHKRDPSARVRPPLHDTTRTHIKDACKRAGLSADISAHALRHGFADAAEAAGVGVRTLADLLRNDPQVALRYQGRDVARLREAAERISAAMGEEPKVQHK